MTELDITQVEQRLVVVIMEEHWEAAAYAILTMHCTPA